MKCFIFNIINRGLTNVENLSTSHHSSLNINTLSSEEFLYFNEHKDFFNIFDFTYFHKKIKKFSKIKSFSLDIR